jgi:hypothetical protein
MSAAFAYLPDGASGDWLPYFVVTWLTVWIGSLALVLRRPDYDPITRLTWVIVVIFVPFFGVLLYWLVAPDSRTRRIEPMSDVSGTPWEKKHS